MAGTALLVLALAAALAAWRGASGSSHPADALSYLVTGGLGGILLAAIALTLLTTAHLDRTITQLLDVRHNCSSEQKG